MRECGEATASPEEGVDGGGGEEGPGLLPR